jgi:CheY-like chemotaxis protein
MAESHPESSEDKRYKETEKIARNIKTEKSGLDESLEKNLPNLDHGETKRQESVATDTSRSQSNQRADDKQTLLLVEDNLINQKVLRRQLQTRGFEVFTANNGQEAIDAVAERGKIAKGDPHDRNYFDIILMDQEMPIKDGNAATQEIRELQEQGKAGYSHILGVSANVREAQTRSMRDAGMDDVISKPFKVEDLVKRIKSIILEDQPVKDSENEPPARNTSKNDEVQMLEDIPIRSRSEVSNNPKHGMEVGGKAKIELGGKEHNDVHPEDLPKQASIEKGDKKADGTVASNSKSDAKSGGGSAKQEQEEELERNLGKAGKKSGREGEARGGERSRSRQARGNTTTSGT